MRPPPGAYAAVALAALFSAARFFFPARGAETFGAFGTYEAFAHLVCGGLAGAWLVTRRGVYLWSFLGLTAAELVAFFTKR